MFTVYHSNQLDVLKSLLARLMTLSPLPSPFDAESILVQSPGMAQWLKQALASELGVMANVTFPLPSSFMWQMFHRVLPDVPEENPYVKPAMLWRLMELLPATHEDPVFAPLTGYLADDVDGRRCYQLCQRIADLFDQYLVYRPDWIVDWEAGGALGADQQPWQPELWRRLVALTESQASHLHRVNLFTQFIAALSSAERPASLPLRVFIFGISSLPPHYLAALAALGRHCDVHLLLTNPCQLYWGDIQEEQQLNRRLLQQLLSKRREQWQTGALSQPVLPADQWETLFNEAGEQQGNPLLVSMGKQGRDYLALIAELDGAEIDAFVDIPADSLLHHLQRDLLLLQDGIRQHPKFMLAATDHSVCLHGCHSPMREVEVLQDQLLHYFEQDPTLTPKDVIVMVSDINRYGPYIQAVFSSAPPERFIPFSISDRSATQENPLLQSFMTLLDLPHLRCTSAELLDLLAVPAMLQQFGLDEPDLAAARDWVQRAGIRWGMEAADGARFDLPPRERHTWQFGLERLLLGFASGSEQLFEDIAPCTVVEGQQAVRLGQLAQFFQQILRLRRELESAVTLTEWARRVDELLLVFYLPEEQLSEEDADAVRLIRSVMQQWQERLRTMQYQATIPLSVFHDHLHSELMAVKGGQKFLSGRVNFCTLMPMRAIPFRLVCLLGMNDGWYPRSTPPLGFDLMVGQARRGDRSRREDDRYLFLEALMAAQDRLYISYVAHSAQDNRSLMPSVLVTELLDYCARSACLPADVELAAADQEAHVQAHLITEHPLVPYDTRYFNGDAGLSWFSYAREWVPALQPQAPDDFLREPLPLPDEFNHPEQPVELELADLQRFCRNPVAGFFQRRLRVYFYDASPLLDDQEPFCLNKLEQYQLRSRLLQAQRSGIEEPVWRARLLAEGGLPDGAFGELALQDDVNNLQPLVDALAPWPPQQAQRDSFYLSLPDWRLLVSIPDLYPQQLVRYRVSKLKASWLVAAWLEHLALSAVGHLARPTRLLTLANGVLSQMQWLPLSQDAATAQLDYWWQFYRTALQQPCCTAWETGWSWLGKASNKDETGQPVLGDTEQRQSAWHAAEKSYLGDDFTMGEGQDLYIHRCFPELTPEVRQEIERWAETLLLPIYQHMQEVSDD